MNYLALRVWFIVSVTLAIGAMIVRLVWEITTATTTGTLVIMVLISLAVIGLYAFILYFTIKPSLESLISLPVRIWVTLILTATVIGGIIHFIRFIPSPEAALPISVVIASMFLAAGVSGYILALWVIWFVRKA